MNAKKCDRCNKFYMECDRTLEVVKPTSIEYDNKAKPDEMSNVVLTISFNRRYYFGRSQVEDMDMKDTLDLCPKCAEKVLSVLYNHEENSTNEK